MTKEQIIEHLNRLIPNPKCELNYKTDYEFLLAVMLSAQTTDKRVNEVTKDLFNNRTLKDLDDLSYEVVEKALHSLGSSSKKAKYFKSITKRILNECNGIVPCDQTYLETLPGVGRKTTNVVLSELFDIPTIAVDTHVERVAKRLKLAKEKDDVLTIEKKLKKFFVKEEYNRINHQLLLFGRYICTAKKPNCQDCPFKEICNYYNQKPQL